MITAKQMQDIIRDHIEVVECATDDILKTLDSDIDFRTVDNDARFFMVEAWDALINAKSRLLQAKEAYREI